MPHWVSRGDNISQAQGGKKAVKWTLDVETGKTNISEVLPGEVQFKGFRAANLYLR